jgi:hypothetical protein
VKPADWAWAVLAASVAAYEFHASRREHDWELLSEAMDRYRQRHPVLTVTVILLLAGHLTRVIPRQLDPLHRFAVRLSQR